MFVYLWKEQYFHNVVFRYVSNVQTFKSWFKGINVLEDENLRQGIKDFSDWPTIHNYM